MIIKVNELKEKKQEEETKKQKTKKVNEEKVQAVGNIRPYIMNI